MIDGLTGRCYRLEIRAKERLSAGYGEPPGAN
ncbi:cell division protein FtsZ [Mariprofundus ferrooxydans]|uniref:Cell division protein FtsZ n=1 Tax=Mariprofundus ferrooxydans PV-1 TaxID=314345 RepID=Q0EYI1_9PROT|nr:cell division protein FtsZ [Mariprofundus ferrooxydans PV-1]KON47398.1 cell division protein FtsZ [Mariprofundus ferrooxydans]